MTDEGKKERKSTQVLAVYNSAANERPPIGRGVGLKRHCDCRPRHNRLLVVPLYNHDMEGDFRQGCRLFQAWRPRASARSHEPGKI